MPNLGLKKGQEYVAKDYAHLKNMKVCIEGFKVNFGLGK